MPNLEMPLWPEEWQNASNGAVPDAPDSPDYSPLTDDEPGGILSGLPAQRDWRLADSGIHMALPTGAVGGIDFSGTAPPEVLPWQNRASQPVAVPSVPPQSDGGGFHNGLTTYQPDVSLSGARPVSDEGMDFIKRYELSPKTHQVDLSIFPDSQKNQTFGYGHLLDESPAGRAAFQRQLDDMTDDQKQALADRYFSDDVRQARANVFNRLGSEGVARLSQPQYDALVADSFNAGRAPALGPNMAKDIRNGDLSAAGQEFNAYWAKNAQTGEWELPRGLVGRSLQEAQLFNNGDYNYGPLRADIDAVIANAGPKPRR